MAAPTGRAPRWIFPCHAEFHDGRTMCAPTCHIPDHTGRGGACPSRLPRLQRAPGRRAPRNGIKTVGADVTIGPQPPPHHPGPAVLVGRTSDRPPPGCGSTREKNVFDQDRRMGRKAGIKSPPKGVLRNHGFLSRFLGTFVRTQKYLARRRNLPSRPPTKKRLPAKQRAKSPHPTH